MNEIFNQVAGIVLLIFVILGFIVFCAFLFWEMLKVLFPAIAITVKEIKDILMRRI